MTSKNSFWDSMKQNFKRRNWMIVLNFLVFFFAYPISLLLMLGRARSKRDLILTDDDIMYVKDSLYHHVEANQVITLLILLCAVVLAIQGFSYLYSRKKVDMYHSVPVSGRKRFWVIWVNGILIYLGCYVLNLLGGLLLIQVNGFLTGKIVLGALVGLLKNLLYFLAAYHLALIGVMLTGNMIVTMLGVGVLFFYELIMRWLFRSFCSRYFSSYTYFYAEGERVWTVPFDNMMFEGWLDVAAKDVWYTLIHLLVLIVVYGAVAYILYRKRPAEASGSAMVFNVTKPVIKICLIIAVSMAATLLFDTYTYENEELPIVGLSLGILLAHGFIEVIYEFDLRAVLKHTGSMAAAAGCMVFIYCAFQFDLFGYDTFVPRAEQVKSAALLADYSYVEVYNEEAENMYMDQARFKEKYMFLTDVEPVCKLAERNMGRKDWGGSEQLFVTVLYRMKSGRRVARNFRIAYEEPETIALMNEILGSMAYKEGTYQVYRPIITEHLDEMNMSIQDAVNEVSIPQRDKGRLLKAYQKDLAKLDFSTELEGKICRVIRLHREKSLREQEWEFPVYDSFHETLSYLKENNLLQEQILKAEDIAEINVEYERTIEAETEDTPADIATVVTITERAAEWKTDTYRFTEEEEIAEIISCLYPRSWNRFCDISRQMKGDCYVTITAKPNISWNMQIKEKLDQNRYRFRADRIPKCVQERIKLSESVY